MLKWLFVVKKYHYKKGIRRTHKFRNFIVIFASVSILAVFPAISSFFGAQNQPDHLLQSNQVSTAEAAENMSQPTSPIPWPNYGVAAYGVPADNLFASSPDADKAVPIASLAKVITVLAVLQEKPLNPGEQGPSITLDQADADLVEEYARKNGAYVPVEPGEKISQYQAMEAVLMVSSNNMSDSLVRWAFGSVDEYIAYANSMLKDMGLKNTVVADDASGYSPNTKSTPEELTILGQKFMENPVLREITMQSQAEIPVAGVISNNNDFLNKDGLIGIKVGDTDEAGKCFIAAGIQKDEKGSEKISIAVVLGADDFVIAAKDAESILRAGNKGFELVP